MANGILSVVQGATHNTLQYRLPEADRQTILAQAGEDCTQHTERLRVAFMAAHGGCAFGQNTQTTGRK